MTCVEKPLSSIDDYVSEIDTGCMGKNEINAVIEYSCDVPVVKSEATAVAVDSTPSIQQL